MPFKHLGFSEESTWKRYNQDMEEKNPNWGGPRPGSGRPALYLKLTRDEVRLLVRNIQAPKKGAPVEVVLEKLKLFAR